MTRSLIVMPSDLFSSVAIRKSHALVRLDPKCTHAYIAFYILGSWLLSLVFEINRMQRLIKGNISVKFDDNTLNGLII